jgi:hypothetical protein
LARRRGGELRRRLQDGGVHGTDNKRRRRAPHLLAQLRKFSLTARQRRSRGLDGGGELELGFRQGAAQEAAGDGCSGRASRGRRRLIKAWGGVRATHGEACSRRTRAAAQPRPSPGRARRGGSGEAGRLGRNSNGCCARQAARPARLLGWLLAGLGRRRGCGLPSWAAATAAAGCYALGWVEVRVGPAG